MLFYNCSCSYIMWRIFGLPCIHLVEWHKCCTSWHFTSVHNLENICGCSVWVDHQMKQSTNTYNSLLSSPLKLSSHLYNESLSQQRTYRYWWGGGGGGSLPISKANCNCRRNMRKWNFWADKIFVGTIPSYGGSLQFPIYISVLN
jgi:hypothetical protein